MNNGQSPQFITKAHLFALVFFAVLIFLLYQLVRILAPFTSAFLWAAVLALALRPIYKILALRFNKHPGIASGIMTLTTMVLVIGPAITLLSVLAAQAVDIYAWASGLVQSGKLNEEWNRIVGPALDSILANPALSSLDIKGAIIKTLSQFSSHMASQLGGLLKNLLVLGIDLAIMLIALFFFFLNGESYYRSAMDLLPFSDLHKQSIARNMKDTFTAVVNGVFLVALLQGFMTGLGFAIFGVSFPVFWGVIAAGMALLPVGGAALVWLPGAAYVYLTGSTLKAILLVVWGTLFVSLPDNFLKPLIIGRKAHISSFFLFIAILGGLQVYGFLGILLGPLVVTLLTVFVQIYREQYAR